MRAEVLGVERRRRWSRDAKARLVAETLAPGACISDIARRNGIVPSLLFTWRRRTRVQVSKAEPVSLPIEVTETPTVVSSSVEAPVKRRRRKAAGMIEIALGSGRSSKVGADVDAAALTRVLDDGRVCLSNNAAERALRGIAVGRRNWSLAGSDAGGHRAAAMYTRIETANSPPASPRCFACRSLKPAPLNGVDPRAWLADVVARLPGHPATRAADLLPWNWAVPADARQAA